MSISSEITRITGNIADAYTAVSDKGGTLPSVQNSDNLAVAVQSIPTGGVTPVPAALSKGVNFIDCKGAVVAAWEASSVASKTSLPPNPSHTGLVAQGWNWSLADIKSYISSYPNATVYVGQMYKTASGLTEIDITLTRFTGLTVTCKMSGNKNWGDGTTDNTTEHTYTDYGNYTITCDGTTIPAGASGSGGMFGSASSSVSAYWCTAIRIGEHVTSIGAYAFTNCYSLTNVTIPSSVKSIATYSFSACQSLTDVTIPSGVTSIGTYAFTGCYSVSYVTIPSGVTSIGNYLFNNCYSLTNVTIPSGVKSIGTSAFANCYSVSYVTIPSGVTSIPSNAFANDRSITTYDFTATASVPTLTSSAFTNINGICKIVVPDDLYDEWIVATNWVTYADYIYKASEVVE